MKSESEGWIMYCTVVLRRPVYTYRLQAMQSIEVSLPEEPRQRSSAFLKHSLLDVFCVDSRHSDFEILITSCINNAKFRAHEAGKKGEGL